MRKPVLLFCLTVSFSPLQAFFADVEGEQPGPHSCSDVKKDKGWNDVTRESMNFELRNGKFDVFYARANKATYTVVCRAESTEPFPDETKLCNPGAHLAGEWKMRRTELSVTIGKDAWNNHVLNLRRILMRTPISQKKSVIQEESAKLCSTQLRANNFSYFEGNCCREAGPGNPPNPPGDVNVVETGNPLVDGRTNACINTFCERSEDYNQDVRYGWACKHADGTDISDINAAQVEGSAVGCANACRSGNIHCIGKFNGIENPQDVINGKNLRDPLFPIRILPCSDFSSEEARNKCDPESDMDADTNDVSTPYYADPYSY